MRRSTDEPAACRPGRSALRARPSRRRHRPGRVAPRLESLESRRLLSAAAGQADALAALAAIPMAFEANAGQLDPQVAYVARGPGYALFLTPDSATLDLPNPAAADGSDPGAIGGVALRTRFVGASPAAAVRAVDTLPFTTNYFLGADPAGWRGDVANAARVEYDDLYPGIDLLYYGNGRQLEYDYTVAPGADPAAIRMAFDGADGMTLDAAGNLVLHTAVGDVTQHAPVAYQTIAGQRHPVASRFVVAADGTVGFALGDYDPSQPLTIDPVLGYSTYLGGSGYDSFPSVAVDGAGYVYVAGLTDSADFPTTPGAYATTRPLSGGVGFVAKLDLNQPGPGALVYASYFTARPSGIAVDGSGRIYLAGTIQQPTLPVTANAYQKALNGYSDAFVSVLDPAQLGTASLLYSTYFGGSDGDFEDGLVVSNAGIITVFGTTTSADCPVTPTAIQATKGGWDDVVIFQIDPSRSGAAGLVYSTFLGGADPLFGPVGTEKTSGIVVDRDGIIYAAGITFSNDFPITADAFQGVNGGNYDGFLTKIDPSRAGRAGLLYSTFLGSKGFDAAGPLAVDDAGRVYVVVNTSSTDLPTTPDAFQSTLRGGNDAWVGVLDTTRAGGVSLIYASFFGGSVYDGAQGIALDSQGQLVLCGITDSADLPTTGDALSRRLSGSRDLFVARFDTTRAGAAGLTYATYFGGGGTEESPDMAVDGAGRIFLVGQTNSVDLPTTTGAYQRSLRGSTDVLVARIDPAVAPLITTTTLFAPTGPTVYGQPATFSVIVTAGGQGVFDGSVTFRDGTTILAAGVPLDGLGRARFITTALTASASPHTITASYSSYFGSYLPSSGTASQSVSQAPLRVVADDIDAGHGGPLPALTVHYTGFVNGDTAAVVSGQPNLSVAATGASPVGRYPITGEIGTLAAANYRFVGPTPGTLTVHPVVNDVRVLYGNRSTSVVGLGRTLPFLSIQALDLIFSDDVAIQISALRVTRSGAAVGGTLLYDSAVNTAHWFTSPALVTGAYTATLDLTRAVAAVDASIAAWGNASWTFNVLPGDASGDGYVTSADLSYVYATTARPYDPFADVNGDGVVDMLDVLAVRQRLNTRLR